MKKEKAAERSRSWEIKKLGEVCTSASSNVSQNKLANDEGYYPIFGASGLIKKVSFYHQDKPYLSIVKDGSGVGRVTKMDAYTSVIGTLQYILPKENIDLDYLNYSLMSVDFKKYVAGAAIPHIYFKDYKNEPFLWMPLPEQQRIVSILDKAFAVIERSRNNAEQNLKNAKELFESYLEKCLNPDSYDFYDENDLKNQRNHTNQKNHSSDKWEVKKLQDVAKVFGRGKSKHRPRNWEGLYGGDYPFIQTGEVRNANKYISSYTQTYNEVGLAQSKLWKKGTICITIAANIAETAILDFDACIPDSIIGFEVDEKEADLNFAYYLLQYFKAELQKLGKGSAQDNINLGTFENQYFPFPSLKEQQTIVRQLDALRAETQKLEAVYQQKIVDLEELKKSVLQKAFAGELRSPEGAASANDGYSPSEKKQDKP